MDFGKLLNEWERLSARPGGLDKAAAAEDRARAAELARRTARERAERSAEAVAARKAAEAERGMEAWLAAHPIPDKDASPGEGGELADRAAEAARLRELRPQATIDLHGMTAAEAESALSVFLESQARRGLEKVLIVTGKGNHSAGEPVLGKAARRVLESSPWAGRFGAADSASGGRGALWALLRRSSISTSRGR